MKDSLNYVGFSNTLIVSRKRKKTSQANNTTIEAGEIGGNDQSKYCPPYMMQQSTVKDALK